jgi:hypothetical protein
MVSRIVSRTTVAAALTLGAMNCTTSDTDESSGTTAIPGGDVRAGMFLHGQLRQKQGAELRPFSAPPGAHLSYFGGRIVSNIQVVQVIYGAGSYIPGVLSTATPSMASFYQGVLNSAYVDWLTEYNSNTQPLPNSNQTLGRGSFGQQVTITPSAANNGTVIDDDQIQAEISAQIAAGTLPAPTHDGAGNNNTYYAMFFPHGKTITLGGATSCQVFCAYHGTIANAGGQGEIYYGVHPDFQVGSGCENGCGAATTEFGNYTQVASHELIETMTDPEIGIATVLGPPLAWLDPVFSEIGDICNDQNGHVVGGDGVTYDVQTEFSNSINDCIVSNALATPVLVSPGTADVCAGSTVIDTVTLLGGPGKFTSDVTLSLSGVNPPAPGITAAFDPNPVPTPTPAGSTSAMRIATAPTVAPGTYSLTVQAASSTLTANGSTSLTVRTGVPGPANLLSPPNNADGVSSTPTFTWSAVPQAAAYELDIFDGSDCAGAPLQAVNTSGTTFTVPPADALKAFQSFSWRVSASNSCGPAATSACFNFRTASCSDPIEFVSNGGFENGLAGWSVDIAVPPPVVGTERPHSGANAVLLGTITGTTEPLGDVQISQVMTLDPNSNVTLGFWEWPFTTDSVTFDQEYVRVTPINPPGATVVLMNEARNDQTYIHREFDLSAFAGQTIKLTFGVHQDGFGDVTGVFVDDITLTSQHCGPPDFEIAVRTATPEICAGNALTFNVAVNSINGPNFTSQVQLSATNLPPNTTATFARNPIGPGESTTLTLTTTRPIPTAPYTINVNGVPLNPPPASRTTSTTVVIDEVAPNAPELISPHNGEVNVPRRPTLSWTAPFVPEAPVSTGKTTTPQQTAQNSLGRPMFDWELAANKPPLPSKIGTQPPGTPGTPTGRMLGGSSPVGGKSVTPFAFGAPTYHLQLARDASFADLVVDTQVSTTSFTVPSDLAIATQYFWRVSATNACGGSAFSATGTFIVGACFEGWTQGAVIPVTSGPSQSTVVASPANGKLYVIGGGTGAGPNTRIDQVWAFDSVTNAWTRKTDVPAPGIGSNFGAAALLDGKIYAFGGVIGPPGPITVTSAAWRYDIASDSWTRLADEPVANFGSAVAAIGGKIYLAYGTGFLTQTWAYDPAANTYTRVANAPAITTTNRVHAAVLGGEMHVFGGGFEGSAHVIYNPATDTWRTGPAMPFTATDPGVSVLAGRAIVVGGRPIAHMQLFDPGTNTWSQGPTIVTPGGVDNTTGTVLGQTFHLIGGFDGTNGVSTHWQFHACNIGGLSSAAYLPFVIDGNGTAGTTNERTALLLDNTVSGIDLSVSCFLFGTDGAVLGRDTFSVPPNQLRTVPDVVRALTKTTGVQNKAGSIVMFGTEVFHSMASIVNNASADPAMEDGQPLAGTTSGYVSAVGTSGNITQAVFSNTAATTALVTVAAYPPGGGETPASATVVNVPPHGQANIPNILQRLGLGPTFTGQMSWTSSQPIGVMARDLRINRPFSGIDPSHTAADARSTVVVPYVEDTADFSTSLEISNPGSSTANVTVKFVDSADPNGETSGVSHTRDIPVSVNSGAPIADIVRWALRDTGTAASGKRGFLVVTTPQAVTAQARLVNRFSLDPSVVDSNTSLVNGFSPLLVRVDPFSPIRPDAIAAAAAGTSSSRFAVSNPGAGSATVTLTAVNATGSAAGLPLVLTLAPSGQFFSDNLARDMGLPPVFLGWVTIQSTSSVVVYNHRVSADGGATIPVH